MGNDGVPPSSTPATTTQVVFQFTLVPDRSVDASVTTMLFTGRDASGATRFGPLEQPKASRIVLENVPTSVVSFEIYYLTQGFPTGVSNVAVDLSAGPVVITDPAITLLAPVLVSLTLSPTDPTVAVGVQQSFVATGLFMDGSRANLTSAVTWTSSDPTVATISSDGVATARASGATLIQAMRSGIGASTTLTVTP